MTKILIGIACVLGAVACGGPDAGGPAEVTARRVSFSSEVLPILVQSCGFSECHGSARGGNNGVFLGAQGPGGAKGANDANDAKAIRAGLVNRASTESPSMPYVTPSDPSRSFLYRKLEGDMGRLSDCGSGGNACGQPMPRGGDKLDATSLTIIRSWIAQGAEDAEDASE